PGEAVGVRPLDATRAPAELPGGVPSGLLQRRPDIGAEQDRLRATAARVGVARALFFPDFTLNLSAGAASISTGSLFLPGSFAMDFLASAAVPLFRGGALEANFDANVAAYRQEVAVYQQTVLIALRETADAVSQVEELTTERDRLRQAVADQHRSYQLASRPGSPARAVDEGRIGACQAGPPTPPARGASPPARFLGVCARVALHASVESGMRLASKIFLASSLVILVLVGVAAWSLLAVDRLVSVNREITTQTLPSLRLQAGLRDSMLTLVRLEARSLLLRDPTYDGLWDERADHTRSALEQLARYLTSDAERGHLEETQLAFAEYRAAVRSERALLGRGYL